MVITLLLEVTHPSHPWTDEMNIFINIIELIHIENSVHMYLLTHTK